MMMNFKTYRKVENSLDNMVRITKNKDEKERSNFIYYILVGIFIILILLNLPVLCQSHGDHDHEHDHEPPSFKYSKQANEDFQKKIEEHVHGSNKHIHDHDHWNEDEENKPHWRHESELKNHQGDVFLQAFGSTLLISAAPFFILFFVPLDNTKEREPLLKILLSFASGGLLGDAFLHLIPHALVEDHSHEHGHHEHSHDHSHDHEDKHAHGHSHGHGMAVGLCILTGIITFLVVEKAIRIIKGEGGHSHSHGETNIPKKSDKNKNKAKEKSDKSDESTDKQDKSDKLVKPVDDIKIAGYLNLAADFLHNFTDGLAIGASFLAGNNVGYITTFTILLHEVPHEIGDFAILIQSGCSKSKAMWLQLITAFGALLGSYLSLLAGGMGNIATKWILPFTAGGFIYIATVSVIPELLTDTKFWQSVKEIIALLVGVYMMVLIAQYE